MVLSVQTHDRDDSFASFGAKETGLLPSHMPLFVVHNSGASSLRVHIDGIGNYIMSKVFKVLDNGTEGNWGGDRKSSAVSSDCTTVSNKHEKEKLAEILKEADKRLDALCNKHKEVELAAIRKEAEQRLAEELEDDKKEFAENYQKLEEQKENLSERQKEAKRLGEQIEVAKTRLAANFELLASAEKKLAINLAMEKIERVKVIGVSEELVKEQEEFANKLAVEKQTLREKIASMKKLTRLQVEALAIKEVLASSREELIARIEKSIAKKEGYLESALEEQVKKTLELLSLRGEED